MSDELDHSISHFANPFVNALSPDTQDRWYSCQASHRFNSFYGKNLVIYSMQDDRSVVLDTLECKELKVDLRAGVSSLWLGNTGKEIWIGHVPTEIAPSCFLWHMHSTYMVFNEHKGRYNLRFSMACRTAKNPMTKLNGYTYLLEHNTYQSFFPKAT